MKTQDIALVIKAPLAIKGIKKPSFDVEAQNDRHQFSTLLCKVSGTFLLPQDYSFHPVSHHHGNCGCAASRCAGELSNKEAQERRTTSSVFSGGKNIDEV